MGHAVSVGQDVFTDEPEQASMEVNCKGCAGCCVDWRPLTDIDIDHERRGPFVPLDDTYNLAPLLGEEVRDFLDAGLGGALTPRLFHADSTDDGTSASVTVDGVDLAAIDGRPAFYVGLRKVPKPVAPFDTPPTWLQSCVFLDPDTLQCRIHDTDRYPETCRTYPGENLALDAETECERVESVHGGDRLRDDTPPEGVEPRFGPAAVGSKVFAHPETDRIKGAVRRFVDDDLTREDRAAFVAVAAASSPGTLTVNDDRYRQAREQALRGDSWVDSAIEEWTQRADAPGSPAPDPASEDFEEGLGAPETPGWDGIGDEA